MLSVMMIIRGRRWDRWWKVDWSGHLTVPPYNHIHFSAWGFPAIPYNIIIDGDKYTVIAKRKDGQLVCVPYGAT